MKKNKKKINFKKTIVLFFIVFVCYLFLIYSNTLIENLSSLFHVSNSNNYKIIKQDYNENYSGSGQQKVANKDGYFTIFITGEKNKKTYKEYKQNGNSSWSNKKYWGGTMAENGCGITVMSIILSGYKKNYTPEDLRKKYEPVINYEELSKELNSTFGIKNSNFYYDSTHLSKSSLISHLNTNRPIIICVWNKPNNNRWTTASHYMALLATDTNENLVYVSNPNGLENDTKSSGWYPIDEIIPYLAKALYIESY